MIDTIKNKFIRRIYKRISKYEFNLSKKENKVMEKDNISQELKLIRDILDRIDMYYSDKYPVPIRHYRYFTLKVDDIGDSNEKKI